ncbi:ABC transporter permease [Geochorda subterranea]|uniref:ABC transporter permease n=1 Tax=Geochorda subterranea TaxID=3109564 RepID=A0ABZ1BMB2_9FIRM|nr:ABC transporter permease [Limnochorda sp. LNt]WRP13946.1 ABC transporter permease [Limnochorda sp. LNt]
MATPVRTETVSAVQVGIGWLGLRRLRRHYLLAIGGSIVAVVVVLTLLAGMVAPHPPTQAVGERLAPPGPGHWMGTDQLRRDVLSRVLHGGRVPLAVAAIATVISLSAGALLGWISGFWGGAMDRVLCLVMDAMYSFPALVLAIVVVAMLGPGMLNMIVAIGIVYIPTYFRLARSQTLEVRAMEHVEASQALGASRLRTLFLHVAPLTVPALLAVTSFTVADAILTEAALAFLGFGLPPPTPDWGFDIQNGQKFLQAGHWWLVAFPGAFIILVSVGFGMLGEGLNDLLDPRRRHVR